MSRSTTVIDELRRIAAENEGALRPATVVDEARDESSPLHSHFEWDVEKNAEAYLLVQARDLIRSAKVRIEEREVRQFVHIRPTLVEASSEESRPTGHYRSLDDLAHDTSARETFLAQMESEWRSFRRRWRDYGDALNELVRREYPEVG